MSDRKPPSRRRWVETNSQNETAEHALRVWAAMLEQGTPFCRMTLHETHCTWAAHYATKHHPPEVIELIRHVFRHNRRYWPTPDAIADTAATLGRTHNVTHTELQAIVWAAVRGTGKALNEIMQGGI